MMLRAHSMVEGCALLTAVAKSCSTHSPLLPGHGPMPPNLLLPASTLPVMHLPSTTHSASSDMCPCPRPPAWSAHPQQAKLGIPAVAIHTMEMYTTAVLRATLRPPKPPKCDEWRKLMDELSDWSCKAYRAIVVEHPHFISYFQTATPESELGGLNIGEGHKDGMGCVPRLSSALQSFSSAGDQLVQVWVCLLHLVFN